ncbi:hypothetical protein A5647_07285 [Mycobacterium sp. 1100029.7]|nr:hypothetical protein A5647_07285 [Mycobacterium sp. 1100029.7]
MLDTDGGFADDVPIADAVEQQRATGDTPAPEDDATDSDIPLETTDFDWQEQRETVIIDPELDEPGQ